MAGLRLECREALDQLLAGDRRERLRIDVAAVAREAQIDELRDSATARAARELRQVVGETPAGVEGRAVDGDRRAANQRFEAGERRECFDAVALADQAEDVGVGDLDIGERAAVGRIDAARTQAFGDVRMRLVDDEGAGVAAAHGAQQFQIDVAGGEIDRVRDRHADRGIGGDLAGDQDALTPWRCWKAMRWAGKVVF